jgi:hypothetical protein
MNDSPLLRHARERMAKQRELDRQRWEVQPAALQKSTLLWILRIIAFLILMGLVYYRMTGHRIF